MKTKSLTFTLTGCFLLAIKPTNIDSSMISDELGAMVGAIEVRATNIGETLMIL
jgi:hypothetical protein